MVFQRKLISVKAHLEGKFLLRSGQYSNEYFDKYLFEARPDLLKEIASGMSELIPQGIEVLAGLEMGGIPNKYFKRRRSDIASLFDNGIY